MLPGVLGLRGVCVWDMLKTAGGIQNSGGYEDEGVPVLQTAREVDEELLMARVHRAPRILMLHALQTQRMHNLWQSHNAQ